MGEKPSRRIWKALEDVFIVLSVLVLWPGILGWEGLAWEVLKYAAVVGLIWILIRRVNRYRRRPEEEDDPTVPPARPE